MKGKVLAVCRSKEKGTMKKEISSGKLIKDYGLEGDSHRGKWHRQLSLLDKNSIDKMRGKGYEISHGDFAENITTAGLDLYKLPVGQKIQINNNIILEVTQIGKKCHHDCEIAQKIGECVMPEEGIFARVIKGGIITAGDEIKVLDSI